MSEEAINPEVIPPEQTETRVAVAGNLASMIASVAQYAEKRLAGASEWLETHGGTVTAETLAEAKKIRTSVNYAERDAADKRKEIQRAVADALAGNEMQPPVDDDVAVEIANELRGRARRGGRAYEQVVRAREGLFRPGAVRRHTRRARRRVNHVEALVEILR